MIRAISLGAMLGWVAGAVVLGEDGGVEWRDYIKASNSEAYDRFGGSGGIALAGEMGTSDPKRFLNHVVSLIRDLDAS